MSAGRSHSVAELSRHTGFDRRTIVYYIQQGLIERPGRRGPNTRYPGETLTRLQFIRGVKELQQRGQLLNVTLADIRRAMAARDTAGLQDLLDRSMPVAEVEPLLAVAVHTAPAPPDSPAPMPPPAATPPAPETGGPAALTRPADPPPRERRAFGLADANVRQRFAPGGTAPAATAPALAAPPPVGATPASATPAPAPSRTPLEAGDTDLGTLLRELEIRPAMSGRRLLPGAAEQWTEIPITSRVYLSVRGLSAEDAPLADATARALKKLLRGP